jgi:ubiquitin carboxyl-terminal hydrolase L5
MLDLGPTISSFKDFTASLTPALRGYALSQDFEFVRRIHNSFGRKRDMLNVDLSLARRFKERRKANESDDEDEGESAFHFIAFVPIDGEVWQMDGMDRQPWNIGPAGDNWIELVRPIITSRMEQYAENETNFSLLAVVKDPLLELVPELTQNILWIKALTARMDVMTSEWRNFALPDELEREDAVLKTVDGGYGITSDMLVSARLSPEQESTLQQSSIETLKIARKDAINSQALLRAQIREEKQKEETDAEDAEKRRFDHTPAIMAWLEMLAGKPEFAELMKRYPL